MFEHITFQSILQDMLDEVPDDVDKREGSIIYDALAPAAMKLAETYSDLDIILRLTFADTSDGDYLRRRVAEHGVYPDLASKAIRKGIFTDTQSRPMNIPVNSRFRLNDIIYQAISQISDGEYRLESETPGVVGNQEYGDLLPVESIDGLGRAILSDVLIPGEDEESDESLYAKFVESLIDHPFGGNRADYRKKIMDIQGVGGVQLYRTPNGGGTVKAVIIDSTFNVPNKELVDSVQNAIDPIEVTGEGFGTAPIGHKVVIEAVQSVNVDFSTTLVLNELTVGQVEPLVISVFEKYLEEIRKEWKKGESLVLRISHLESRILAIDGVQDILNTTLNGNPGNIILPREIPVKGSVIINE
ncbi:baseplate J/gp47 family protein [Bacillus sp. Gen3]|nr:baseplate J/gp47 family protein [Bacillus sp. Gen3]